MCPLPTSLLPYAIFQLLFYPTTSPNLSPTLRLSNLPSTQRLPRPLNKVAKSLTRGRSLGTGQGMRDGERAEGGWRRPGRRGETASAPRDNLLRSRGQPAELQEECNNNSFESAPVRTRVPFQPRARRKFLRARRALRSSRTMKSFH